VYKEIKIALASFALVFSLSTAAPAQVNSDTMDPATHSTVTGEQDNFSLPNTDVKRPGDSTSESTTINNTIDSTTTTTSTMDSTNSSFGLTAEQHAALVAHEQQFMGRINPIFNKYHSQVMSVLTFDQGKTYQGLIMNEDRFEMAALTENDLVGYLAYLTTRLGLSGPQRESIEQIHHNMIAELGPLYQAYLNERSAMLAQFRDQNRTTVSTTTTIIEERAISTPSTETTIETQQTEVTAPVQQDVQVRGTQTRTFIRNRDLK
jgi:hypothetical protein